MVVTAWARWAVDSPVMVKACFCVAAFTPCYLYWERRSEHRLTVEYRRRVTDKIYFDIAIGDLYAGRIIIGLYGLDVPLTCENVLQLTKGFRIKDREIGYRNTLFHFVKPNFGLQAGDVVRGNGSSKGLSIYGLEFPDENFDMKFTQIGDVSMTYAGPNANCSQFSISLFPSNMTLQGKSVVFGTVLKGMRVCHDISNCGTRTGRPLKDIRILGCGIFDEEVAQKPIPYEYIQNQSPRLNEEEWKENRELGVLI